VSRVLLAARDAQWQGAASVDAPDRDPLLARSSRPGFLLTLAALERLGHSRVADLYSRATEGLQDDAVTLVDDVMADAPPQRQRARWTTTRRTARGPA
jgi:hypothetical protein